MIWPFLKRIMSDVSLFLKFQCSMMFVMFSKNASCIFEIMLLQKCNKLSVYCTKLGNIHLIYIHCKCTKKPLQEFHINVVWLLPVISVISIVTPFVSCFVSEVSGVSALIHLRCQRCPGHMRPLRLRHLRPLRQKKTDSLDMCGGCMYTLAKKS